MTTGAPVSPAIETLADLHERLGNVPLQRIRCHPAPGTATEADVLVFLGSFLEAHDLGIVLGADATLRLAPGLVRLPDVSFIAWEHFPNRELPAEPVPDLVPDFVIEVLSSGDTAAEMERKLQEYFAAGVRLVWYVYPEQRTVHVYTSPHDVRILHEADRLDGGSVLPGFQLLIQQWFARAGRRLAVGGAHPAP